MADEELLIYIRTVNLDILWGTSKGTVSTNKGNIKKGLTMCKELGVKPTYPVLGPFPLSDEVGFTVALQMLKASRLPGKYSETHQQFDSIRSLRSAYSNLFEAGWKAEKRGE